MKGSGHTGVQHSCAAVSVILYNVVVSSKELTTIFSKQARFETIISHPLKSNEIHGLTVPKNMQNNPTYQKKNMMNSFPRKTCAVSFSIPLR